MAKKKPLKGPNLSAHYKVQSDRSVHVDQPVERDSDGRPQHNTIVDRGFLRQMGVARMTLGGGDSERILLYGHTQVSDGDTAYAGRGPAAGFMLTRNTAEQMVAMLLQALYGDVEA